MNFNKSLEELYFNLETLNILSSENVNEKELFEISKSLNYSKNLTNFLLNTQPSYLNSVVVRLKAFNKLNKSEEDVKEIMKKYPNTLSLVNKLYCSNTKDINETTDEATNADQEDDLKLNDSEDKKEDNVDENSDEQNEDPFLIFYNNNVKETKDKKDVVKTSEFYNKFRKWYTNEYDENVPSKKELKVFLGDKLGKTSGSKWQGIVINSL